MLLLLTACAPGPTPDPEPVCEGTDPGTETCPMDTCALSCGGVACCIETHGRGLEGADLERLLAHCEGEECDPDQYLSAAAAVCAAQVHGLPAGVDECTAAFIWEGEFHWRARNDLDLPCEEDWDLEGTSGEYYLHPITGAFEARTQLMYQVDSCG